jgi:hypothetical protein
MSDVNTAVTLIKNGQKDEAQAILKEIIRLEPHNIPAWFWMAETLETNADKLKVMEVCKKLNPNDPKVQKAYDMLKEVQATDSGKAPAEPGEPVSEAASTQVKPETGEEKEIPAAPFAEVAVIQSATELFGPSTPESEPPKEKDVPAAAFAAIPVVHAAAERFTPPPPTPPLAQEERPSSSPFVEEGVVVAAAANLSTSSPALEPLPEDVNSQKPKRKRSWKWIIPAIIISFVVFLCSGVSWIYIRQLFP